MRCVRGTLFISALAVAGLSVLIGCTQLQTHDSLVDLIKDRHGTNTTPNSGQDSHTIPRENDGRLPPYAIKPSDVLTIEVLAKGSKADTTEPLPNQPISGQYTVQANGTVDLGVWGSVPVADLSVAGASVAIRERLEKSPLPASVVEGLAVKVEIHTYSQRYYVITEGPNKTEQVREFPLTGAETVLDAIAGVDGLADVASKKSVRVVRKKTDNAADEVLPVDWVAITQHGAVKTNYQLQPGDRIYVTAK